LILFLFSGNKGHPVKLLGLKQAIELINVLPGKNAKACRRQCATIVVRYLGGDYKLIDEIMGNAQSKDPLHKMAQGALKRGREEMEDGAGGAVVKASGIDSGTFLAAIKCFENMQEKQMQMQEKHTQTVVNAEVKAAIAEKEKEFLQVLAAKEKEFLQAKIDELERAAAGRR